MNDDKSPAVDPWRELRNLNDLDLGVLAYEAGPSPERMRQALPVTVDMRRSAGQETPGEWAEAFGRLARDGARVRASLPPPLDAELDALASYLGQPRERLVEGAQRLVDHNQQLASARAAAVEECKRLERLIAELHGRDQWRSWAIGTVGNGWASRAAAAIGHTPALHEGDDRARELLALAVEQAEQFMRERWAHNRAADALLAIGQALDVVGTGKPWAEIGKAGVSAVEALRADLKTARQGWADQSAEAARARVERDKSRAEVATLTEQIATWRAWGHKIAGTGALDVGLRTLIGDRLANAARVVAQHEATYADLNANLASLRRQRDELQAERTEWHRWAKCIVGPRAGAGEELRSAVSNRLGDLNVEFTTLREAARTLLPADSTPNPATCWLADVIRSRGATITSLRADLTVAQDTAAGWMAKHDAFAAQADDLRGRLAAAEKMAEGWKTSAFALRAAHVRSEDLDSHRLPSTSTHARPHSMATDAAGVHLGFALPAAGLAIRLTCDEVVRLRGWLINAAGLPGIEPQKPAQLEPLRRAAAALIDAAAALALPKAA